MRVVLATGSLDVGGVEAVVAMLAEGLASYGVDPVVLCSRGGRTAQRLRISGVTVQEAGDEAAAARAFAEIHPDVVQLHSPPMYIVEAARARRLALVPVVHNFDIHRRASEWKYAAAVAADSWATIAVSATVAEHHRRLLPEAACVRLHVIANGASTKPTSEQAGPSRLVARRLLSELSGVPRQAVVVVCLARYDAQKNLTGLVEAFLDAAMHRPRLHLVVAGEPVDRLELRRVDAHRRSRSRGNQVHLLGHSDAATLLAAGDVFVLNSFYEGWPVSATEAATAGLPLLLADVGGGSELVRAGVHGVVVPNPCGGNAASVNGRKVRRARRRVRDQPNRTEVADALVKLHDELPLWAEQRDQLSTTAWLSLRPAVMVEGHARVLRAAGTRRPASSGVGSTS